MGSRLVGVVVAVSLVVVAGCSAPPDPSLAGAPSDLPVAAPVEQASSDTAESTNGDIAMVVDSQASLKEDYATIRELASSKTVVTIVRGRVSAVRDVYFSRVAFRLLTVDVSEGLRVTAGLRGQSGQQISVTEDGGVLPWGTVAADFPPKLGSPAPQRDPSSLVDFRFMGSRHSEVGDDVVLFLGVNPNAGTPIETEYNMVSSVRGRFTLDLKTNQFVRALGTPEREFRPGYVKAADVGTLKTEISAAR
jgi:hypothetical protein